MKYLLTAIYGFLLAAFCFYVLLLHFGWQYFIIVLLTSLAAGIYFHFVRSSTSGTYSFVLFWGSLLALVLGVSATFILLIAFGHLGSSAGAMSMLHFVG